ncbi:MAG: cytidylate kinase-like family protein [Nitrosarchaeum sp.]|nr:cytidylate kinase-like family protein [Nitrosarchaeum sp.]
MKKLYKLIQDNFLTSHVSEMFRKTYSGEQLPLITLSRESGSGGRPIAFLVAKKLGKPWKVFHKDIVEEIAQKTNLEQKLIDEVDENNIPLIEELIADVFGKQYLTLTNYQKQLVRILSAIGNRGHAIIIGRGSHYLFPHALKIRIICNIKQRIDWIMEYEKLTKKQAINFIEKSDKQRLKFERTLYHHDWYKANHYDLVIQTGMNISIEDASETIVFLAKKKFRL